MIERGGFDGSYSAVPPFRDSHLFDHVHCDIGLRMEMIDVRIEDTLEASGGFIGEGYGFGCHAVAKRVQR
jgi:hypothetical protein